MGMGDGKCLRENVIESESGAEGIILRVLDCHVILSLHNNNKRVFVEPYVAGVHFLASSPKGVRRLTVKSPCHSIFNTKRTLLFPIRVKHPGKVSLLGI
jgi:hypothetical protein